MLEVRNRLPVHMQVDAEHGKMQGKSMAYRMRKGYRPGHCMTAPSLVHQVQRDALAVLQPEEQYPYSEPTLLI